MAWVVDTCLLIDIAEADPVCGLPSATLLDAKRRAETVRLNPNKTNARA